MFGRRLADGGQHGFAWGTAGRFAVILFSVWWVSACQKIKPADEPSVPPAMTKTNQPALPNAAVGRASTGLPIAANPVSGGANLRELNHAYLRWIAQNRRRPTSYENFLALSGFQVPPPPTGKKYVIDKNGFIALADIP